MDMRLALYELAAQHRLDSGAVGRLERLAGLADEPDSLSRRMPRGIAVLAAALAGLGVIFWVAANWETLGRFGRFALLEGVVLAACLAAAYRAGTRAAFGLVALLAIGGVFAYFGQTYQTGADPWQLFALWTALALPLCLGVRSDVTWAPWALVAMVAISLWVHAHTGYRWQAETGNLSVHLIGWATALAVVVALGPQSRRFTGAGPWALRTALSLSVVMITATALSALFGRTVAPHFWVALGALAVMALLFSLPRRFDVYGVSAAALGINTLLVAGLAWLMFHDRSSREPIGELLLIGLTAAGLLSATVTGVLHLARRRARQGESA